MYAPVVADILTFFYPIGNTPAVQLTRDLPRETSADILLLGCGDARNILFTVYAEHDSSMRLTLPWLLGISLMMAARKLDITCCDIQGAIIGMYALLL